MNSLSLCGISETGTEEIGAIIANGLFPGAFIALYGELGAGKTTLARAIARGAGIDDIQSPTFTIVREHRGGRYPLFHFDAYRVTSADELYDIGYGDYLTENGVIIMEWCENVPGALPQNRLDVKIVGSGNFPREISVEPHGADYLPILVMLKKLGTSLC